MKNKIAFLQDHGIAYQLLSGRLLAQDTDGVSSRFVDVSDWTFRALTHWMGY